MNAPEFQVPYEGATARIAIHELERLVEFERATLAARQPESDTDRPSVAEVHFEDGDVLYLVIGLESGRPLKFDQMGEPFYYGSRSAAQADVDHMLYEIESRKMTCGFCRGSGEVNCRPCVTCRGEGRS